MDLRYTSSGTAVGQFILAVNRNFTNQNGDREADFINCVIWRKQRNLLPIMPEKAHSLVLQDGFKHGTMKTNNTNGSM